MMMVEGGEPLMKLPFSLTFTFTVIEDAGKGFALSVNVADWPSVTLEEFRVIVTTGISKFEPSAPTTPVSALSQ